MVPLGPARGDRSLRGCRVEVPRLGFMTERVRAEFAKITEDASPA